MGNGTFKAHELPFMAQISSVKTMIAEDFNADGLTDLFLLGNDSEISTQLGRLDASHGVLLINAEAGFRYENTPEINITGSVRSSTPIIIKNEKYYSIGRNNDQPLFIKKEIINE